MDLGISHENTCGSTNTSEITSPAASTSNYSNLICQCKWLMKPVMQMEEIVVKHNFRQANNIAHLLAKESLMQSDSSNLCTFVCYLAIINK